VFPWVSCLTANISNKSTTLSFFKALLDKKVWQHMCNPGMCIKLAKRISKNGTLTKSPSKEYLVEEATKLISEAKLEEAKNDVTTSPTSSAVSKLGNITLFRSTTIDIIGDLGEGNFGKVYKVRIDIDGKKTVAAMKRVGNNTDLSKEILDELNIFSKLKRHPNLLLFYGITTNQIHFLSEYCAKGSLDKLHKDLDLASEDRFWQVVEGVLKGLAALHKSGLVHRDIACRNLFMKEDGSVVLGDFGLSRITDDSNIYSLTKRSMMPWCWCAPETLLQREHREKSDIWMFGVTVWEILTKGKHPQKELSSLENYKSELKNGRMPLKIPEGPPRAKTLLRLCFQFDIKENKSGGPERVIVDTTNRPTASEMIQKLAGWSKEGIQDDDLKEQAHDNGYDDGYYNALKA